MAGIGTYIKSGISILNRLSEKKFEPVKMQERELRKLLKSARFTRFGKMHYFNNILASTLGTLFDRYKELVPIHNYSEMNRGWWQKAREGEQDVFWPGKVNYFALSSGTSEAASKYIPITEEMVGSIRKTAIRQLLSIQKYDFPPELFESEVMVLSGCSNLIDKGCYFEGDLSGIQVTKLPNWFKNFYRPGREIADIRDWSEKLDVIARNAHKWNIGVIMGVPAWNQIMMEKIIEYHNLKTIHDIWPNLSIFVHGGVALEPYMQGFNKLLGKPITFMETYLASEGFLAYQTNPGKKEMQLVLDNGVFFEFVPFTEENFDEDRDIKPGAKTLTIGEVEENVEYAVLISTCSGAWRYLIGDVVKFTSKEQCEILITGRTKHFLSVCGEHLSIENLNAAISYVAGKLKIDIREFTVAGIPHNTLFAHQWFIGTEDRIDAELLKQELDQKLKELNRDYNTRRGLSLQEVFVEVVPSEIFYKYHKLIGKEGGQNKFPRVISGEKLENWQLFIEKEKVHYHKETITY
jgi:hypothetical protein